MSGRFVRLLLVLACAVPLLAQETRAAGLRQRIATMQPGSPDWFNAQAELTEALFDVDVVAARGDAGGRQAQKIGDDHGSHQFDRRGAIFATR